MFPFVVHRTVTCALASILLPPSWALRLPPLVPAVHLFTPTGSASSLFQLSNHIRIIVNQHDALSTKDGGLSLIYPSLLAYTQTFKADLEELFPQTSVSLFVSDSQNSFHASNVIAISLSDELNATYADGTATTEGYSIEVSSTNIHITASGSKGAFWATRTLLQGLVLTAGQFPTGKVVDQPDWSTRGFMLGLYLF